MDSDASWYIHTNLDCAHTGWKDFALLYLYIAGFAEILQTCRLPTGNISLNANLKKQNKTKQKLKNDAINDITVIYSTIWACIFSITS